MNPPEFETLLGLVSRYSPSEKEAEAANWLVERMNQLGFERAFIDPAGNPTGVIGRGPRQVVMLGHIDTVPGEISVRIEDGKLFGRGSVDAKGPLASFVDAAIQAGAPEDWQIVVIGAVDEERNSAGARQVAGLYKPDFAIIGEPSGWDRITLGYKGSAWAEIKTCQEVTHTASRSPSACEVAFATWQSLLNQADNFNQGRGRLFDQLQVSLRSISSGADGFEEWACMRVGSRLPLDLPPRAWFSWLKECIPVGEVQPVGYPIPAYLAEKNTTLVRSFLASIRQTKGEPRFILKTGTADINIVAPEWGCPAVAYGPGDSALDHTRNEHIELAEFLLSVEVLKQALLLCFQNHRSSDLKASA